MRAFLKRLGTILHVLLFAVITLLLLVVILVLWIQKSWDRPPELNPVQAFYHGSIGTEIAPLPVFVALPVLFPENFQPQGPDAGPWHEQFGMNRHIRDTVSDPDNKYDLPTGFYLSNKRPKSGAPSPVKFVGISCVMCHSTELRRPEGGAQFVVGPGNSSLNLFAWIDAFQTSVMDEQRLTVDAVCRTFQRETGEQVTTAQRLMIRLWLRGVRRTVAEAATKFGDPFAGSEVLHPHNVPTGPGRTQPFRTLVRRLLDRPGADMAVYTKVGTVFWEQRRKWAQVDGSIRDLHVRSSVAAFAAGATVQNMKIPDVVHNIRQASDFTKKLSTYGYYEVFPEQAANRDPALIEQGRGVYMDHCADCHGSPAGDHGWKNGKWTGEIVPVTEIGTDPERVTFRRFDELPDLIVAMYPEDHPFHIDREGIRPNQTERTQGYINTPLERAYARAPYLHNASVLTLAELINLKRRRTTFYRGRNTYDVTDVGLASPNEPSNETYFYFDARLRGNSNQGHDYPWPYDSADRDPQALRALLEFLKTL